MRKNIMIALICVAIILICVSPLFVGVMSRSYEHMNSTVNESNPARVGVDVGWGATAGLSGLIWPVIIIILGALFMILMWKFTKAAGGK